MLTQFFSPYPIYYTVLFLLTLAALAGICNNHLCGYSQVKHFNIPPAQQWCR